MCLLALLPSCDKQMPNCQQTCPRTMLESSSSSLSSFMSPGREQLAYDYKVSSQKGTIQGAILSGAGTGRHPYPAVVPASPRGFLDLHLPFSRMLHGLGPCCLMAASRLHPFPKLTCPLACPEMTSLLPSSRPEPLLGPPSTLAGTGALQCGLPPTLLGRYCC